MEKMKGCLEYEIEPIASLTEKKDDDCPYRMEIGRVKYSGNTRSGIEIAMTFEKPNGHRVWQKGVVLTKDETEKLKKVLNNLVY